MKRYLFLLLIIVACNPSTESNRFQNMDQDEIFQSRLSDGGKQFADALKKINYPTWANQNDFSYDKLIKFIDQKEYYLIPYLLGTSGFDSENDGVYKYMMLQLMRSVNNKYAITDYKELDKFFDSDDNLMAIYKLKEDVWDTDIVNSSSKQLKTISFKLNGNLYSKEFEQFTDRVNADIVINQLLNGALENEGFNEKWHLLPSVDQTYNVLFATNEFYKKLNEEGFIGTQEYFNQLSF